jgi:hypothetical protein
MTARIARLGRITATFVMLLDESRWSVFLYTNVCNGS